jgi:hypothetical protein
VTAIAKLVLPIAFTAISFGGIVSAESEPVVSVSALKAVEAATDKQFQPDATDPWDLLGEARGTYLPGYGAVFTFEMNLVNVTPISPFHMTVTPQEVKSIHERKLRKLVLLKGAMRDLLVKAASSLNTLPPAEQITFEAYIFAFSFEDRTGLPRRLTVTANRQKLLDAVALHATPADLAAIIEVQEE